MGNKLPTDYQTFIHKSRYARWDETTGKREDWEDTVNRYFSFFPRSIPKWVKDEVLSLGVMPSMRALMTAGVALEKDNVAGYNCSYVAIDSPIAWDEAMYVLMCGTGVGFSCERQYVSQLPVIQPPDERASLLREEITDASLAPVLDSMDNTALRRLYEPHMFPGVDGDELSLIQGNTIIVADSKYGWASAFRILIMELYNCNWDVTWDVSSVRPAGARLNTFGGRASGPDPLISLFTFTKEVFQRAEGRKLSSIEAHDIMCKVADIVVVGGVRRSALISLSNLTDQRMSRAKSGQWWVDNPQRALANNSVCYTEKPDMAAFMEEWRNLYESKSGERGVFSRVASEQQAAKNGRRAPYGDFGTNPCSEIILRSKQFCNLTEIVVRPDDSLTDLLRKAEAATILGTAQASLTSFKYLSADWRKNTEEEALLGVSMTGIMDHPVLSGKEGYTWPNGDTVYLEDALRSIKERCIDVNLVWARKLGVNRAAAITCVKPSGTVSQLVDSASGIHPRYAPYYVRTVRQDNKDPLTEFLRDQGVPNEPCAMKPDSTTIFSFPMKSPPEAVQRDDRSAIEQLEFWKLYQTWWCEHKPSVTIYVKEHEWMAVGAWVYEHFDAISGVSFLPHSDHTYAQAPYQEISEEEWKDFLGDMPEIDWDRLFDYESTDMTEGQQTLACVAGVCEL